MKECNEHGVSKKDICKFRRYEKNKCGVMEAGTFNYMCRPVNTVKLLYMYVVGMSLS